MHQIWKGLSPSKVMDMHVHLVGIGDSAADTLANPSARPWANPAMDSLAHPGQYLQKRIYMNAACANTPGQVDTDYVARLDELTAAFPPGARILLLAFEQTYHESGRALPELSSFYVPNEYTAHVARSNPTRYSWAASVHPYREDAVEEVHRVAAAGAVAIKWLPAAMNIDPASPRCDAFYDAMARCDLPLITHAGAEKAVAGQDVQRYGNPLKLRRAMEHGVRVVVAHCASDGDDDDLDAGPRGRRVPSFSLLARMMSDANYDKHLFADISATLQFNRMEVAKAILSHTDWHPRLLNGSDYPLPGVLPLTWLRRLQHHGLLSADTVPFLSQLRQHNALLFDFALKRLLRQNGGQLPVSVFETQPFFRLSA